MAHGVHNPELKAKVISLRIEDRLSYGQIAQLTGVPKGTLSNWLNDLPLTEEEKNQKRHVPLPKSQGIESKWSKTFDKNDFGKNQKGKIAEAAILFRLFLNNLSPYGSLFDGEKADWVVVNSKSNKTFKLQVRWAKKYKTGLPVISLTRTTKAGKRTFKEGDFDFIVGYNFYNDTAYVFSYDEVKNYSQAISVREDAAEAWHKLQ